MLCVMFQVMMISAVENNGIDTMWETVQDYKTTMEVYNYIYTCTDIILCMYKIHVLVYALTMNSFHMYYEAKSKAIHLISFLMSFYYSVLVIWKQ